MNIQNVQVEIRVNGRAVRHYNNDGKIFIESRENSEYSIHVKNDNPYRILAVPSVDSISTLDGKEASHKSGGYIIESYQSYDIKGFRKDFSTVGAFKFVKKSKGYAATKGQIKNSGIISVAVFKEKDAPLTAQNTITYINNYPYWWYYQQPVWTYPNYTFTCGSTSISAVSNSINNSSNTVYLNNCSASNSEQHYGSPCSDNILREAKLAPDREEVAQQSFNHATNWGKKLEDKVTSGSFERETIIAEFNIYYDSKEGLEEMGIKTVPQKQVVFPQGFSNFCQPPVSWYK